MSLCTYYVLDKNDVRPLERDLANWSSDETKLLSLFRKVRLSCLGYQGITKSIGITQAAPTTRARQGMTSLFQVVQINVHSYWIRFGEGKTVVNRAPKFNVDKVEMKGFNESGRLSNCELIYSQLHTAGTQTNRRQTENVYVEIFSQLIWILSLLR